VPSEFYLVTDLTAKTITLDRSLDVAVSVANKVPVAPAWAMVKAYGKTHLELKISPSTATATRWRVLSGRENIRIIPGPNR